MDVRISGKIARLILVDVDCHTADPVDDLRELFKIHGNIIRHVQVIVIVQIFYGHRRAAPGVGIGQLGK